MSESISERREKLQNELKALEKEENLVREELFKAKNEAWSKISCQYEWSVKPDTYTSFSNGTLNGARITRRVKAELYEPFIEQWGMMAVDNKWEGMFYYRTDENILTAEGGGSWILKEPKLCSDEEWSSILEGNIPEKFLK